MGKMWRSCEQRYEEDHHDEWIEQYYPPPYCWREILIRILVKLGIKINDHTKCYEGECDKCPCARTSWRY